MRRPRTDAELRQHVWHNNVSRNGDCLEWLGACSKLGYGIITVGGNCHHVHRISWMLSNGPIPKGMSILHHCDNRKCVNPKHLWLGTQADNVRDMENKGRSKKSKGEQHGRVKLTNNQVQEIRERYALGDESQSRLAALFGITQSHVSKIILGDSWKHLG